MCRRKKNHKRITGIAIFRAGREPINHKIKPPRKNKSSISTIKLNGFALILSPINQRSCFLHSVSFFCSRFKKGVFCGICFFRNVYAGALCKCWMPTAPATILCFSETSFFSGLSIVGECSLFIHQLFGVRSLFFIQISFFFKAQNYISNTQWRQL